MITDAIIDFFFAAVVAVLDLLPDWTPPDWLDGISGSVGTIFGYANSLGAWLPLSLLKNIIGVVVGAWGVALVIKGVRIALSFFTAGGGSAA